VEIVEEGLAHNIYVAGGQQTAKSLRPSHPTAQIGKLRTLRVPEYEHAFYSPCALVHDLYRSLHWSRCAGRCTFHVAEGNNNYEFCPRD